MEVLEYIKLEENELRTFFKKYSARQLEFFEQIYGFVFDPELYSTKKLLDEVYSKKMLKVKFEELKKMNDPLNINSLSNKNHLLTDKELNFLYNLICEASSCVDVTDYVQQNINISNLYDKIYDEIQTRNSSIMPVMSKEELEIFFEKFDLHKLEIFELVINEIKDYDISDILNISRKVYNKKCKELDSEEYEMSHLVSHHISGNISDIINDTENLSIKEFTYLKALIENFDNNYFSKEKVLELKK